MFWLLVPLIAASCYAMCTFIDNFSVDIYCRKLNPMSMAGVFAILEVIVCIVIFIWQGEALIDGVGLSMILTFMGAALIRRFGAIPYYKALKKGEATEITLLSQMSPIIALILGIVLLHQIIKPIQLVAFFLILSAVILVVLGSGRRRAKVELKVGTYMLAACFCWVFADITFAFGAIETGFIVSFFWFMLGNALMRLLMVGVFKSWRHDLARLLKRNKLKKLFTISMNEIIWLGGEIAWRYGLTIMPVAIMSVTGNVLQLIVTFLLGVGLTLIWPKFGREKLSKKLILHHAAATGIVAVAVVLLGT